MPPKTPQYGSPLLAILRGGKEAVKPTVKPTVQPQIGPVAPVKFGLPTNLVNPVDIVANGKQALMPNSTAPQVTRPVGGKLVIPSIAKEIIQGTARGAAATGSYLGARAVGLPAEQADRTEFNPDTLAKKLIFGDKPFSVKTEAIDPLISMGASERAANKYGAPLLLLSTLADTLTGGGKKKLLQDALVKANDTITARTVLKNAGIADDAINTFALDSAVVGLKTPAEADEFIKRIVDSSKASKPVDKVAKIAADMTEEDATIIRRMYEKQGSGIPTNYVDEDNLKKALGINKLPSDEQREALNKVLEAYDQRWGGVDEVLNPPVQPNRAGALDIKPRTQLPPKPKPVSVSSDNLTTEAKGYKSAEEFMKAQGAPVYRAGEKGNFFSDSFDYVQQGKFPGKVNEVVFPPQAKLFDASKGTVELNKLANKEELAILNNKPTDTQLRSVWNTILEREGYDGMKFMDEFSDGSKSAQTFFVTDSAKANLKTKSQLTDIWNKANPKKKSLSSMFAKSLNEDISNLTEEYTGVTLRPKTKKKGFFQTFKDMSPAERQGGYGLNKPSEFPKKVEPIDRLIAENKVRVRMIDGKDTYEVKKGGEWKAVRDEDSAIKQATPKPKTPIDTITRKQQLPDELEEKLMAIDFAKEALDADPAKELSKYVSRSTGRLPEVTGKRTMSAISGSKKVVNTGKFGREGDQIIQEVYGMDRQMTTAQASDAYDAYKLRKEEVLAQEKAVKEEIKLYKATEKLKQKTVIPEQAIDRVREIQKIAPEQVRSLEEVAQQINEVLDLPPKMRAEPLTKIVTQTPVTKKVNLLDYLRTPDRVLNKIGFGKEAKLLREQYEKYVIELPKNIDTVSDWAKRVPKESNERIFDYLDGADIKLNPKEQAVANEIKEYLKTWADRLNLPEDKRVTNYITRLFEDSLIQKEFDEDLAKIISEKIPGQVYDPFLEKRLGAKGYKRDTWAALDAYTKRATRKVHMDVALERIKEKAGSSLEYTNLEESQFKYIQTYINRVQMRPTDIDNLIDNGVKSMFGYRFGQRPVAYLSQLLRRMTYRGMLGGNLGSAVRNLSQGVNTYATLGEKYTAIGYGKLFSTNARKELAEQGILASNFIDDRTLSSTKQALQKADKALWFFFDQAEKINRGAAYFGAKAKGLNKGMPEKEAIEYAKSIVRKTQFAYDSIDAPVAMAGDLVKTLTQFQTFTVKQSEFLIELAKDKNYLGLLRYAIGGYIFVNTVGQALGMEEKEMLPYLRFDTPPSLKVPVEIAKAAFNVPDKYGNVPDTEKKISNIGKATLGLIPAGSQIKKTYEGTKYVQEGGSYDKSGRLQFEQTDTPSGKVQSVLFGKYSSPQAKEYFNKEVNTGDKDLDKFIEKSNKENAERTKEVATLVTELKKLPPEQANARLTEIAETDKQLAIKIRDKVKEEKKRATWTKQDEAISKLGVENGKRAEYIYSKASKMNPQEANAYIADLYKKGVISKNVVEQLKELKAKDNGIIE